MGGGGGGGGGGGARWGTAERQLVIKLLVELRSDAEAGKQAASVLAVIRKTTT